jgi:hypothetical protein
LKEFIRENLAFSIAYLIFTGAAVAMVAAFRLLPFVDLPNHLAAATICRHIAEPGNLFAQYFETDLWLNSNIFHTLFLMAPVFPGVEFANHVYYSVYAALLPLSVLLIVRRLAGNIWLALPAFLLINNYNVMWGFSGYAMAIPLAIFHFHLTIKALTERSWCARAGAIVLPVMLFFVHAQMALFVMVLFTVSSLYYHRRKLRLGFAELILLLPAVLLLLVWWFSREGQPGTLPFLVDYYSGSYWQWFYFRWRLLVYENFFLFSLPAGYYVALAFTLVMIAPLLVKLGQRQLGGSPMLKRPDVRLAIILPLLSLVLYVIVPQEIPGQPIVYERFSVLFMLGVIISGSVFYADRLARIYKVLLLAAVAAYFVCWFDHFDKFNDSHADLTPHILPDQPAKETMGGIVYDYTFRDQPLNIHLPYYYTIWKKGITPASFIDYRFGTVRRKVGYRILPPYNPWEGKALGYDGRYQTMDYLLVIGDVPRHLTTRLRLFKPVRTDGNCTLYRNLSN